MFKSDMHGNKDIIFATAEGFEQRNTLVFVELLIKVKIACFFYDKLGPFLPAWLLQCIYFDSYQPVITELCYHQHCRWVNGSRVF